MKTLFLVPVLLLSAAVAQAAHAPLLGSTGFGAIGFTEIREAALEAPGLAGAPQDKVRSMHLLPRTGKSVLIGRAESATQFEEALARWTSILGANGITVGETEYKEDLELYTIAYKAPGGAVLRDFLADPKQFPPKDEAALRANRDLISAAMQDAGLKIVTSYLVDVEFLLPTYISYYLTQPEEDESHEVQVRVHNRGDDIAYGLLEKAGVNIIQKPKDWMMVYIGREIGQVWRLGKTREEVDEKVAARIAWLEERGKEIIATRVLELEEDPYFDFKFLGDIYFYQ